MEITEFYYHHSLSDNIKFNEFEYKNHRISSSVHQLINPTGIMYHWIAYNETNCTFATTIAQRIPEKRPKITGSSGEIRFFPPGLDRYETTEPGRSQRTITTRLPRGGQKQSSAAHRPKITASKWATSTRWLRCSRTAEAMAAARASLVLLAGTLLVQTTLAIYCEFLWRFGVWERSVPFVEKGFGQFFSGCDARFLNFGQKFSIFIYHRNRLINYFYLLFFKILFLIKKFNICISIKKNYNMFNRYQSFFCFVSKQYNEILSIDSKYKPFVFSNPFITSLSEQIVRS